MISLIMAIMKTAAHPTIRGMVMTALAILAMGIWVSWQSPVFDKVVLDTLAASRRPWLDTLFRIVTWGGSLYVLIPLGPILSYTLFHATWRRAAWQLINALLSAALITYGLKFLFDRPRPDTALIDTNLNYAFPSNHASQVTAFMLMLVWLVYRHRPAWLGPIAFFAAAAVLLVSASRVYLQVHHPSDVMAGVLTGVLAAMLIKKWARTLPTHA